MILIEFIASFGEFYIILEKRDKNQSIKLISSIRGDIREQRMVKLKKMIEQALGRELELERDAKGRWSITQEMLQEANMPIDGLVHTNEFDELDLQGLEETSYPWEFFVDRPVNDIGWDEFQNGRALILYPKSSRFTLDELEFMTQSKFGY